MKRDYPSQGIKGLCVLFGKTRAAFYDWKHRKAEATLQEGLVLDLVRSTREHLPRAGVRQLYHTFTKDYQLNIGRDYLFDLLRHHKLLIRQRKRKAITTDSRHWQRKYENLIQNMLVTKSEQVWVSDITYVRMVNGFAYLSLITDVYSKKIMGYCLHRDLSKEGCLQALKMALQQRSSHHQELIHHSDRGSQYCCQEYVQLLQQNNIAISMTNNGDPYENAVAERVNGTVKNEFNIGYTNAGMEATQQLLDKAVFAYNNLRRHSSCDYLTPKEAHHREGPLKKHWKNYYKPRPQAPIFEKDTLLSSLRINKLKCQPQSGLIL